MNVRPLLWLGLLGLALIVWMPPGEAQAFGPCEGVIGGDAVSSDGQRIVLPENGTIDYAFSAASPVRSWVIDMSFGLASATISEGTSDSNSTSISGSANVSEYATFGAGLYEVDATVRLADGQVCKGSVLVEVARNPLTTVAGWVAVAAGAGGAVVAGGASVAGAKAALAGLAKP